MDKRKAAERADMKLKIIKSDNNGETYQAEGFKILYRKKGSTSGDNEINDKELLYLVNGVAKVTIKARTVTYDSPETFEIPARTYHKIEAITDIIILIQGVQTHRD